MKTDNPDCIDCNDTGCDSCGEKYVQVIGTIDSHLKAAMILDLLSEYFPEVSGDFELNGGDAVQRLGDLKEEAQHYIATYVIGGE